MTAPDLFGDAPRDQILGPGAMLLAGFADDPGLPAAIDRITAAAPFRHMVTPGGHVMSVAMTNCGDLGWVTDRRGYRYTRTDPDSGAPWPALPAALGALATRAAARAGFADFMPDACLINRYVPGARMALHQDRNERNFDAPIVSVSLGLPAVFLWGGLERGDRPRRIRLGHGDVVVWGAESRLHFHGVAPLAAGEDAIFGRARINLTLRQAD